MEALRKLKEKPYRGFSELCIGFHPIGQFRAVKNKFAKEDEKDSKSILVELADQVVFLPKHIGERLTESDLEELNLFKEDVFLYFGGKQKRTG